MTEALIIVILGIVVWLVVRARNHPAESARLTGLGGQSRLPAGAAPRQVRRSERPPVPSPRLSAQPGSGTRASWLPKGKATTVAGFDIPGGMIYVGSGLRSVSQVGSLEPGLIDPHLPVDARLRDRACDRMSYWPSYATIPAESRAAYLEWLAGGRQDPGIGIGHVFLFFYGLERRALHDAQSDPAAAEEIPVIAEEVARLLTIYGSQGSFRGYASAFLGILQALGVRQFEETDVPSGPFSPEYEIPLPLRLGLGLRALEGKPVPAEWALAWYLSAPSTRIRTPQQRCPDEFRALFGARYRDRFGDGLVVKPPKKTIDLTYRPASASFGGTVSLTFANRRLAAGVPDVTSLQGPLNKITDVAESCVSDLEPFSRWVGRNPTLRSSPAAVALLPAELVEGHGSDDLAELWSAIEARLEGESLSEIPGSELLDRWRKPGGAKLTRSDLVLFSQLLEKRGYGIEPDVRFGGPALAPEKPCVIFSLPPGSSSAPSAVYAAASTVLQLGVTVAGADEDVDRVEIEHLEAHLERALPVTATEKTRLAAHLRWLMAERPSAAGLKKRLDALERPQREAIAGFLVGVAAADGQVTPAEVTMLGKLYRLLGLDPQGVYSDLHARTTSAAPPATEPVTVRARAASTQSFSIPAPPKAPVARAVSLDMARVEEKIHQTKAVSALLQSIFVEDEEPALQTVPAASAEELIAGLDAQHSGFLRAIASKTAWSRVEVEDVAASFGVLTDGALDMVNEAALTHCGDPLWEGEDPITIDSAVREELLT